MSFGTNDGALFTIFALLILHDSCNSLVTYELSQKNSFVSSIPLVTRVKHQGWIYILTASRFLSTIFDLKQETTLTHASVGWRALVYFTYLWWRWYKSLKLGRLWTSLVQPELVRSWNFRKKMSPTNNRTEKIQLNLGIAFRRCQKSYEITTTSHRGICWAQEEIASVNISKNVSP